MPPMAPNPPPLPRLPQAPQPPGINPAQIVLLGLMWLAWLGITLVADFLAFMMFAFADSPGSAGAAKLMIIPAFLWFGITFVAGVVLLILRRWWQIVLAFVLAISPPFLVFAGYNLLSAPAKPAFNPNTMPMPQPADVPGRFAPPPTSMPHQPDFQSMVRRYSPPATTQSSD